MIRRPSLYAILQSRSHQGFIKPHNNSSILTFNLTWYSALQIPLLPISRRFANYRFCFGLCDRYTFAQARKTESVMQTILNFCKVGFDINCAKLRADLRKLYNWSEDWQMLFNLDNCKIISLDTITLIIFFY